MESFRISESKNEYKMYVDVFCTTGRKVATITLQLNEETKIFEAQKAMLKPTLELLELMENTKIEDMARYLNTAILGSYVTCSRL